MKAVYTILLLLSINAMLYVGTTTILDIDPSAPVGLANSSAQPIYAFSNPDADFSDPNANFKGSGVDAWVNFEPGGGSSMLGDMVGLLVDVVPYALNFIKMIWGFILFPFYLGYILQLGIIGYIPAVVYMALMVFNVVYMLTGRGG